MSRSGSYRSKVKQQDQEVELPSGEKFLLRKPPLTIWISTGRLPQRLTQAMLGAWEKTKTAATEETLSTEEMVEFMQFLREIVCFSCVEPKVVKSIDDPLSSDPDVLLVDELSQEDFNYIYAWAMGSGEATMQVPLGGGMGTAEAVSKFPVGR